jgi:TonB family protein
MARFSADRIRAADARPSNERPPDRPVRCYMLVSVRPSLLFVLCLTLPVAAQTPPVAQAPSAPDRTAAAASLRSGLSKFRTGDLDGAFEDFSQAIVQDPSFAEAFYNRGLTRARRNDSDGGIADFTKAIALNPQYADAYDDRCLARDRERDFDGALSDCTQAIALNPSGARAFNNRAIVRVNKGDLEAAIADYTRAVELNPRYALAYYNRCRAENRTAAYDRAIEDCTRAISINPNYAAAYFARGQAREQKGDAETARTDYLAAHGLDAQYVIPPAKSASAAVNAEVVRPGNGVTMPQVVNQVKPQYTTAAMQAQIQGRVLLECVVKKDGSVGDVRVVRSLDKRTGLDEEAIKAARQWRFVPGTRGDTPVDVLVTIELSFTLEPRRAPVDTNVAGPLGWPRSFAVSAERTSSATETPVATLEESDTRIRWTYPAGWTSAPSPQPGMMILRSAGGTRGISLRSQASNSPALVPLSPEVLTMTIEAVRKRLSQEANVPLDFKDFGQVRLSNGTWVWFETYIPAVSMTKIPALQELQALVDGVESWGFVTSTGSSLLEVDCYLVRPRRSTDAEFTVQIKEAGSDCAGSVQSVAASRDTR